MEGYQKIQNVNIEPPSFWIKWGKPYLMTILWIVAVIVFAYLNIIVGYFSAEEDVNFFSVYAETQKYWLSIFANVSFLSFAGIDYVLTHRNAKPQWFVIVVTSISAVSLFCLPSVVQFFVDSGQTIHMRGKGVNASWLCYVIHGLFIFVLYVLRSETRKVQIIDEYTKSILHTKEESKN